MISVVIIAKNEQELLVGALDSVKWADEVVVIDNDSTDDTAKIAKEHGALVFKTSSKTFSDIRNFSLEKITGEWVLFVDADERVLADLHQEIVEIIGSTPSSAAWAIPRRNIILGEEKKYAAFWPDYVIRLFKREKLKGYHGDVHEQPTYEGELGKIKSPFLHLTHRDIDSMVLKSLSWSNIDANLRLQAGHPPMTGIRFLRILVTEIWNQGIIRRGFFNGTVGVIDSLLQVFSLYISYVKLWQLQRSEPLAKTYATIDKKLKESDFKY